MRVIFLKAVKNVGRLGEIKEVADGYAKNFLLPNNLAKIATDSTVQAVAAQKAGEKKVIDDLKETLRSIQEKTQKEPLILKVKVGSHGEIFGGIHEQDIEKALFSRGFMSVKLDKLERPLKQLGRHKVKIKMDKGIAGEIEVEVKPL